MNANQYELLQSKKISISLDKMKDLKNRTLIYGYDCDRNSFHLYLKDKMFCLLRYSSTNIISYQKGYFLLPNNCIPNKRVYPESCDFEFCELLNDYGISIPFTIFNTQRAKNLKRRKYHGLTVSLDYQGTPFNIERALKTLDIILN